MQNFLRYFNILVLTFSLLIVVNTFFIKENSLFLINILPQNTLNKNSIFNQVFNIFYEAFKNCNKDLIINFSKISEYNSDYEYKYFLGNLIGILICFSIFFIIAIKILTLYLLNIFLIIKNYIFIIRIKNKIHIIINFTINSLLLFLMLKVINFNLPTLKDIYINIYQIYKIFELNFYQYKLEYLIFFLSFLFLNIITLLFFYIIIKNKIKTNLIFNLKNFTFYIGNKNKLYAIFGIIKQIANIIKDIIKIILLKIIYFYIALYIVLYLLMLIELIKKNQILIIYLIIMMIILNIIFKINKQNTTIKLQK